MAYDNRSHGNYGNNRGGYSNRSPQPPKTQFQQSTIVEIKPEPVPTDYVDKAEAVILSLPKDNSGKYKFTTSKIRNLLSLVSDIYNVEKLRTDKELSEESISKIGMMRVRTAYEAGRDDNAKIFIINAKLFEYIKGIGNSRDNFMKFANYMEALVAYHRYFGGREG